MPPMGEMIGAHPCGVSSLSTPKIKKDLKIKKSLYIKQKLNYTIARRYTMKWNEIIRKILSDQKVTQSMLARRLDISKPTLNMRLSQKGIGLPIYMQMLKAVDYKVLVVPADRKVKEDEYEVE